MSYKIIVDSSCEIDEELTKIANIEKVPLHISINETEFIDNEELDIEKMMRTINKSKNTAKTACPSPETYKESFNSLSTDRTYCITLSSKLSGSFNSANLGKDLYLEEHFNKKVFVIDSLLASVGETAILKEIIRLENEDLSFEEIKNKLIDFRNNLKLFFILEDLSTLKKNGRISGLKSIIASSLKVKPILTTEEGSIKEAGKTIGFKKGLLKIKDFVLEDEDIVDKQIFISHCNNLKDALFLKKSLLKNNKELTISIFEMGGLSSVYSNQGGIIISF